jgi:hypothetical protein
MKKFVFASIFALSAFTCSAAETSVVNHGENAPAAVTAVADAAPAPVAVEGTCCETKHHRRHGVVRRAARRTVGACRAVGRAVVRPFGRVFGSRSCCR